MLPGSTKQNTKSVEQKNTNKFFFGKTVSETLKTQKQFINVYTLLFLNYSMLCESCHLCDNVMILSYLLFLNVNPFLFSFLRWVRFEQKQSVQASF